MCNWPNIREHKRTQGLRPGCEQHENIVHADQLQCRKYVEEEEQKDRQKEARPDNNSQYLSMNTAALHIKAFWHDVWDDEKKKKKGRKKERSNL